MDAAGVYQDSLLEVAFRRTYLLWLALLAGCPPFPEQASYICDKDADCGAGDVCSLATHHCVRCVPKTCADFPASCDPISDGCSGTLECACPGAQDRCVNGTCECMPRTCEASGLECGAFDSGCGPISCGTCPDDRICEDNRCAIPASCDRRSCGYGLTDQGLIACGTVCKAPLTCSPDSTCEPRPGCALGQCGFVADRWCGGCGTSEICDPVLHTCARSVRVCWGDPVELDARERFSPAEENGELWLYSESDSLRASDGDVPGCSRHTRQRMLGPTRVSTVAIRVPTGDFPTGTRCDAGSVCQGFAGVPLIRADGLEMFFAAKYPCGYDDQSVLYVSARARTEDPWSAPKVIVGFQYPESAYVLLPDNLTLVFYSGNRWSMGAATRTSSAPGHALFGPSTLTSFADDGGLAQGEGVTALNPMSVTCDGRGLLYYRSILLPGGGYRFDVRVADIVLGAAPYLADPSPYPLDPVPTSVYPQKIAELPDCSALLVRTTNRTYLLPRVSCN